MEIESAMHQLPDPPSESGESEQATGTDEKSDEKFGCTDGCTHW